MARDNRPSAVDLICAEAEARAPTYAFHRLVQMIQDALDDGREVGTHLLPAKERIIFEVDNGLGFPLSDVAGVRLLNPACNGARVDSPPCFVITVTFLGLHGSGSPLPSYYVEQIAGYDPKGSVLTAFFNFFHNRLIGLLHRGWRKYRYYIRYRPGGEDDFSRGIYSLFGLYDARLRSDSGIYWPRLLCFAGVLASRNRSPAVLSTIIRHTFRLERVSIEEWVRRTVFLVFDRGALGQIGRARHTRQLGRQLAVLDLFEVREDGLLDEPVRSAFETSGGIFQPGTQEVVDLDAKGGASHVSFFGYQTNALAKD